MNTAVVVKKHARLLWLLVAIVLGMFAFGFALVPIYNSLCKTLGLNGKTNQEAVAYDATKTAVVEDREVVIEFVATQNNTLDWLFYPKTQKITVHPGAITRLAFYAENKSNFRMTVQAIPSVTPGIAAKYLKKTECFCFTQQSLNSHEAMDMPLLFHIDKDLPKNIKTITLSYTLYDVSHRVIH